MSFAPNVVTRNWRLKLAAFGLAVFLWVVIGSDPDGAAATQIVSGVPVQVRVAPVEWMTAGEPQPSVVEVRLAGGSGLFRSFARGGDLQLRIPIDSVTSEDTLVDLRRDWVVNGNGTRVDVQEINPARVRVLLERAREDAVPLYLRTEGSLPEGLAFARPVTVNPGVVRVRGRASLVEQLDSIAVGPLDLSTVSGSRTRNIPLDTTGLGDLMLRTAEASVDIFVEPAEEETYAGVPVVVDSLPPGADSVTFTMTPATIQVTLRGAAPVLRQARPDDLRALAPWSELASLGIGEARTVPIRLVGVPDLVRAFSTGDSVRVERTNPPDPGGGG